MTTSAAASAEIAKVAQTAVTTEELLSGDSNILDQLLLMFEKGLNQPIVYWQLASILGLFAFSVAVRQVHPHADY